MSTRESRPLPSSKGWIFKNSTITFAMISKGWKRLFSRASLVHSTNSCISFATRYAGVVSNKIFATFPSAPSTPTVFSFFLYTPRCIESFVEYLRSWLWSDVTTLSCRGRVSKLSNTFWSVSRYPCTSCESRSVNLDTASPRMIFSTSLSVSLAPSIRVEEPADVMSVDFLRFAMACGVIRRPDLNSPRIPSISPKKATICGSGVLIRWSNL